MIKMIHPGRARVYKARAGHAGHGRVQSGRREGGLQRALLHGRGAARARARAAAGRAGEGGAPRAGAGARGLELRGRGRPAELRDAHRRGHGRGRDRGGARQGRDRARAEPRLQRRRRAHRAEAAGGRQARARGLARAQGRARGVLCHRLRGGGPAHALARRAGRAVRRPVGAVRPAVVLNVCLFNKPNHTTHAVPLQARPSRGRGPRGERTRTLEPLKLLHAVEQRRVRVCGDGGIDDGTLDQALCVRELLQESLAVQRLADGAAGELREHGEHDGPLGRACALQHGAVGGELKARLQQVVVIQRALRLLHARERAVAQQGHLHLHGDDGLAVRVHYVRKLVQEDEFKLRRRQQAHQRVRDEDDGVAARQRQRRGVHAGVQLDEQLRVRGSCGAVAKHARDVILRTSENRLQLWTLCFRHAHGGKQHLLRVVVHGLLQLLFACDVNQVAQLLE